MLAIIAVLPSPSNVCSHDDDRWIETPCALGDSGRHRAQYADDGIEASADVHQRAGIPERSGSYLMCNA